MHQHASACVCMHQHASVAYSLYTICIRSALNLYKSCIESVCNTQYVHNVYTIRTQLVYNLYENQHKILVYPQPFSARTFGSSAETPVYLQHGEAPHCRAIRVAVWRHYAPRVCRVCHASNADASVRAQATSYSCIRRSSQGMVLQAGGPRWHDYGIKRCGVE